MSIRATSRKEQRFASTLAIAISLAGFGVAVRAQSFQGTSNVVAGSASVFATGNTTTVTVNSPSAVINWTPTDTAIGGGAINFQPSGTTATFQNNPSNISDFAVLNNILPADPTRQVQFNGTVVSQLQQLSGASSQGGTVYFYSPAGILVGPSAVINVGNLGLSASPIAYDATTGAFGATGAVPGHLDQTVRFGQANAGANIQIFSGAQINANGGEGSYVVAVAPLINNYGTINVNGSAALVAADAATITFSESGLYNISMDVGSSSTGTTLYNGGTITGPVANTAQGFSTHRIYLTTAPKNTVIGLLIGQGSNLGFDVAGAADTFGNAVVLSAGYNVTGGSPDLAHPIGTVGANANVTGTNVTSNLTVAATNNAQVDAFNGATTALASNLTVLGAKTAYLGAFANSTLTANGAVSVQAIDPNLTALSGTSVTGGFAQIFANSGGTVNLHGAATLIADATGVDSSTSATGPGGNGIGGSARISAFQGGTITIDGSTYLSAQGSGGNGLAGGISGGNGTGGTASIVASDTNSTVTFKSSLQIYTNGYGGHAICTTACSAINGTGTGGFAQVIAAQGGTTPGGGSVITSTDATGSPTGGIVTIHADGYGADSFNTPGANGKGGVISINADSGNTLSLGSLRGEAAGYGGLANNTGFTGGIGTGGSANINIQAGGTLTAGGAFRLDSSGYGGEAQGEGGPTGGNGGAGFGGGYCDASNTCISGGASFFSNGGTSNFNGGLFLSSDGYGGGAGQAVGSGAGGTASGGFAGITVNAPSTTGATIFTASATGSLSASGYGGYGNIGGRGTGGRANVTVGSSTVPGTSATATFQGASSTITLRANGVGGSAATGAAGDGIGGSVFISAAAGGVLNLNSVGFVANAQGSGGSQAGSGLVAGKGTGGSATLQLAQGGAVNATGNVQLDASGFGGTGLFNGAGTGADGGDGRGGGFCDASGVCSNGNGARLVSLGGTGTFNGTVTLLSSGVGGTGGTLGTRGSGGSGMGGSAILGVGFGPNSGSNGRLLLNGSTVITAAGKGGDGYRGGNGTGGDSGILSFFGSVTGTSLLIDSTGRGGNGQNGGAGGAGYGGGAGADASTTSGGGATLQALNNSSGPASLTFDNVNLFAEGYGGAGGVSLDPAIASGVGGLGAGGRAVPAAGAGDGLLTVHNTVSVSVNGYGGAGGAGAAGSGTGGTGGAGGAATGGFINAGSVSSGAGVTANGTVHFGNVNLSSSAFGGLGGDGGNIGNATGVGNGGAGGNAIDGNAVLLVRGTSTTIDTTTTINADAIGGNGGAGINIGLGGSAQVGNIGAIGGGAGVLVTNRFQVPTQRGTLTAGAISVSASAQGGTGSATGSTIVGDQPVLFQTTNSDATISSLTLVAGGGSTSATAVPALFSLTNGTVNIGSALQFTSSGPITVALDTATLNSGFVGFTGSDWILPAKPVLAGTINANTGASFRTRNNIVTYANVNFAYPVGFNVPGNFQLGNVTAKGDFSSFSSGTTTFGSLNLLASANPNATQPSSVSIAAGNTITTGAISAPGFVVLDNTAGVGSIAGTGNITTGAITSGIDTEIYTNGSLQALGNIQAGGHVQFRALGSATTGSASTGLPGAITAATYVDVKTGGNALVNGAIQSGNETNFTSQGSVTVGNVTAGNNSGTTDPVPFSIGLIAYGGPVAAGNLSGTQAVGVAASGSITTGTISGTDVLLGAGTSIGTGSITAAGRALLANISMISLGGTPGSGNAYNANLVFGATPVATSGPIAINGTVQTGGFLSAATAQAFTSGAVTSGDTVTINAGGAVQMASISGTNQVTIGADSFTLGQPAAPGTIVTTAGGLLISTVQSLTLPSLSIAGRLDLRTTGALTTGNLTSGSAAVLLTSGAALSAGAIFGATGIVINSAGTASAQVLNSNGAISAMAAGNLSLGNVAARGGAGTVELSSSQGNLTTGAITAATDVAAIANGTLTTSQISGRDIVLLGGGNVQVGSINAGVLTPGGIGTGRVLIANPSAGSAGGQFGSYNFNAVFNATGGSVIPTNPPRSGGTVTVSGPVNAGSFRSYSQGAMTGQVINGANFIEVESGGLVTVAQRWTSPDITIGSNDIAIAPAPVTLPNATVGLNAGTTGSVSLVSLNPNGAFIGDGLTPGSGYALSGAELGLVQSGSVTVAAGVSSATPTTMTIGNLAVTGGSAGSNVGDTSAGTILFATGNPATQAISGTIRVTGALTGKNFAAPNQIQFQTGTFELDNTTGSIAVTDSSNAIGGGISISANQINVASGTVLDKLRTNPFYGGFLTDLNAAPATPSTSGPALSAGVLALTPTQTLYIQNTGTAAAPVGFLVPLTGLRITTPGSSTTQTTASTPTSVTVVINGQFVGTGSTTSSTTGSTATPGNITGMTAFDQFVQQTKLTGITADSTLNGCSITAGSCVMTTPTPSLSSQIQVLSTPALPAAPAVVEVIQQASAEVVADPQNQDQAPDKPTEAEQNEEKKSAAPEKAPIAPPAPMIDTRPLNPPVSIDDPVSGGGNPALYGIGAAATPEGGAQ